MELHELLQMAIDFLSHFHNAKLFKKKTCFNGQIAVAVVGLKIILLHKLWKIYPFITQK